MLEYPAGEPPAFGEMKPVAPGIHWLRMPLPMKLDHINLYLLEDEDGWWIVDTGIGMDASEELWEQVFARDLGGKPVKAVICTHMHPDHVGMAGWLCDRWQVPCYMTELEYLTARAAAALAGEGAGWDSELFFHRAGFDRHQREQASAHLSGYHKVVRRLPRSFYRLSHGDSLVIGGYHWRVVTGSGHSPEHACLYCESRGVFLSGDQVIPRISSNVSVVPVEPEANPLKQWLASHDRLLSMIPRDVLVMPAHNEPFRGLHERLRQLIEHHEEQLLALESSCAAQSHSVTELLPVLFRMPLEGSHRVLATMECLAHLNYLRQCARISRETDAGGIHRYKSIDPTLPQRLHRAGRVPPDEAPEQV